MPKKILAPHRVQDGWVYVRVPRSYLGEPPLFTHEVPPFDDSSPAPIKLYKYFGLDEYEVGYADDTPGSRIISSRRVEEAVETADFLKMLTGEGLYASYWPDGRWLVAAQKLTGNPASGTTLREAYYRHKAEAELDAQQPGPFGDETEPVDDARLCCNCEHIHNGSSSDPCKSCLDYDDSGDWTRPYFERAAR